jgi:hypothetical protein
MVAARERLIELRNERIEALLRLRLYLRGRLGDFLSNVDPITSQRYADLVAEGSKAYGDMSLSLTFFDGTRLRVAVDTSARITISTYPDVLGEMDRVVDLRVRADLAGAEFDYVAKLDSVETTEEVPLRTADFAELIEALVDITVGSTERQVDTMPVQSFDLRRRPRRSGLSFNIR